MQPQREKVKIIKIKPTGNRSVGRPKRRYEENIRMDLKEIGVNVRIDSLQDKYH